MDPDANLEEQLRIAERITNDLGIDYADADRLAELVLALNEWIKGGGFLPKQWVPR